MKKTYLAISMGLLLVGCMSAPSRRYYQINLSVYKEPAAHSFEKIIWVDRVDVDNIYDDFRIVYRESPFQLNFYSYEFWADKPAKLVGDAITHYLVNMQIFKNVVREIPKTEPDLILRSRIHTIEEVDTAAAWYARLEMEMKIVDFRTGELILSCQFQREEQLPEKNVRHVPVVVSRILKEELDRVITELSLKIQ